MVSCPTPNKNTTGHLESNCRYALERTDTFIKVWFWGRDSSDTPAEVANGTGSIDTDNWVPRILFSPER